MGAIFFDDNAGWFTIPGLIGTTVFAFKLLMAFVGDVAGGLHHDVGVDVSHDGDLGQHTDPASIFRFLSIQSVAAFLMGFGWVGLASLHGSDLGWPASATLGLFGAVAMVWLLGLLLKAVYDLQSSGNVSIRDAAGHEGDVYVSIPGSGGGRGQVRVTIRGRSRTYNAVTDGEELATGTRVRVARVNEDNTLSVSRA